MRLLKGYILTSTSNVIKILAALIARTIMARLLGPVHYGGFGVGLNMATLLSRVLTFGCLPAAQYYGSKQDVSRRDHLRTSLLLGLVVALFVTGVGVLLVPSLLEGFWTRQPIGLEVFSQMAPFLGLVILGNVMGIILIPWNRVLQYTIGQLLLGVLIPVVFLTALPFVLPLQAAVLAQISVWLIALIYNVIVMRRELSGGRFHPAHARKMVRYGLLTWPNVILNVGGARLAVLLGAYYLGQMQVGLFIVGLNISEAIFGFHSSLGQLVLSRVSEEETAAFKVTQQVMRLSVILLVTISLLYIAVGKPLLILIFGAEYTASWSLSLILLITGGAHSLGRVSGNFLAGLGKPSRNTITLSGEVLCLILLIPILTARMDTLGLAWASAIAASVSLLISVIQTGRLMECGVRELLLPKPGDLSLCGRLLRTVGISLKGKFSGK
ncbi:MAG: oligosaccharide flippase family protein [bacterium]|nr:oligosaccharide flippase family protein [bacterium]